MPQRFGFSPPWVRTPFTFLAVVCGHATRTSRRRGAINTTTSATSAFVTPPPLRPTVAAAPVPGLFVPAASWVEARQDRVEFSAEAKRLAGLTEDRSASLKARVPGPARGFTAGRCNGASGNCPAKARARCPRLPRRDLARRRRRRGNFPDRCRRRHRRRRRRRDRFASGRERDGRRRPDYGRFARRLWRGSDPPGRRPRRGFDRRASGRDRDGSRRPAGGRLARRSSTRG